MTGGIVAGTVEVMSSSTVTVNDWPEDTPGSTRCGDCPWSSESLKWQGDTRCAVAGGASEAEVIEFAIVSILLY